MNKIVTILVAGFLSVSLVSCVSHETTVKPLIQESQAIQIAQNNVPSGISEGAKFIVYFLHNDWVVHCQLKWGTETTRDQLGWPNEPGVSFINYGLLPEGYYRLLTFVIDPNNGDIIERIASDTTVN